MAIRRAMVLSMLVSGLAMGGTIVTRDGKRYEGDLKKTADGWSVTAADGTVATVAAADVNAIELTSSGGNASERFQSLKRSVEALDEIPKIIERYRRFIEQTKDKALIDSANQEIAVWQDRLDRKLIKVGKRWVTAEEKKQLAVDAVKQAVQSRELIRNGQTAQAQQLIDAILETDADNISALYLQGVLAQKQDKLIEARNAFTAVQKAVPTHAPTLFNLSILSVRQKQWSPAITFMDQSLTAAPDVQMLIDGAAELLNLIPDDLRKSSAAQRLARHFADQDAALQKVMLEQQRYRWGAVWVDQATRDKLADAEKEVKKRVDELQGDFDLTQNRIARIDADTESNLRTMREIEARSYNRLADGTIYRTPYPDSYYEIERDNAKLASERQELVRRLDALRDSARRIQTTLPVAKYTGVIHPIGEDGVPIIVPEGMNPAELAPAQPPQEKRPPLIRIGPANGAD